MVSHIDPDHITGMLDLLRDLERVNDNGGEAFCRIRTLWHNSFEEFTRAGGGLAVGGRGRRARRRGAGGPDGKAAAVVASVRQGANSATPASAWARPQRRCAGESGARAGSRTPCHHRRPGPDAHRPRSARRAIAGTRRRMAGLGAAHPANPERRPPITSTGRRRTCRASYCCSKPHAATARRRCGCS